MTRTVLDAVKGWFSWRPFRAAKPKSTKRTYDRVLHEPCGRMVATSAVSPKRHRCEPKAEVGDASAS